MAKYDAPEAMDPSEGTYTYLKEEIIRELDFMSPPAKLSTDEMVDTVVYLRALKSLIEGREKLLSEVLKSRHKHSIDALTAGQSFLIEGNKVKGLELIMVMQMRLSNQKLEAALGDLEAYKEPSTFVQMRVSKEPK